MLTLLVLYKDEVIDFIVRGTTVRYFDIPFTVSKDIVLRSQILQRANIGVWMCYILLRCKS